MEEQFNQWFDSDIMQMEFVVKGSTVRDIALAAWTKSHEDTLARLSTLGSVLTYDSGVTQKYELLSLDVLNEAQQALLDKVSSVEGWTSLDESDMNEFYDGLNNRLACAKHWKEQSNGQPLDMLAPEPVPKEPTFAGLSDREKISLCRSWFNPYMRKCNSPQSKPVTVTVGAVMTLADMQPNLDPTNGQST